MTTAEPLWPRWYQPLSSLSCVYYFQEMVLTCLEWEFLCLTAILKACQYHHEWLRNLDFFFLILSFKPVLSLSSFTLIKRLLSSSLLSAIRVVSSTYLRLLMFLPPIFIPACNSSSLAFLTICSAYRLNKQGDSRQSCCTPFSVLNLSVVPYRV